MQYDWMDGVEGLTRCVLVVVWKSKESEIALLREEMVSAQEAKRFLEDELAALRESTSEGSDSTRDMYVIFFTTTTTTTDGQCLYAHGC